MALSPKQLAFVAEYLVDLDATKAARRAGYSERTAGQVGFENLRKPDIAAAIRAAQDERSRRTQVTADRVVEELAAVAFFDPASLHEVRSPADVAGLPPEVRRAIIGWSWDKHGNFVLKMASKTTGLEMLGRHLGIFNDKLKHDVTDPLRDLLDSISDTSRGLPGRGLPGKEDGGLG